MSGQRRGIGRETGVNAVLIAGLIVVPLTAWIADAPFVITLCTRVAILALAGVGLNIAIGQGGLVSLGHAAFFGVGGYAMGVLASHAQAFDPIVGEWTGTRSMPLIWLAALAASGLAALAIGALSLRTTGVYFIMITLAFGQMFYYFALSWKAYGGDDGMAIYVRNGFPGLNTLDPIQFYGLTFVLLMAGLYVAHRLAGSAFGLALNAARQAPVRVETVGLSPYRLRLVAFTLSGMITGLAGALFADLNRFVSPSMLSWQTSGEIMVLVILGGTARLFGPVAGAALFITLEHQLGGLTDYWHIWLGALLLCVVLFARGGIIGLAARGPR